MTLMIDTLTLDAPRKTSEGYMAVRAKAARTGLYDYLASEVGAPSDKFQPHDTVKIYRDEAVVFDEAAVRSFIGRPITDNHPREAVTADNWKRHARGVVMGAIRDGDHLAFDLVLMDKATIAAVENGKRELSNGYQSHLDWTPGTTPDGQHYDAKQTNIRGNHVAIVDKGRAGATCAIADGTRFALCDANPAALDTSKEDNRVKVTNLDGMTVNLDDKTAVEQTILNLDTKLTRALDDAASWTGEKTALEQKVADAEAKLTPAALDKLVADRTSLIEQAKALDPRVVTDGKTELEIKRAVVDARCGESAKDLDDAGVAGAFTILAASPGTTDTKPRVLESIRQPAIATDNKLVRDTARDLRYA